MPLIKNSTEQTHGTGEMSGQTDVCSQRVALLGFVCVCVTERKRERSIIGGESYCIYALIILSVNKKKNLNKKCRQSNKPLHF